MLQVGNQEGYSAVDLIYHGLRVLPKGAVALDDLGASEVEESTSLGLDVEYGEQDDLSRGILEVLHLLSGAPSEGHVHDVSVANGV